MTPPLLLIAANMLAVLALAALFLAAWVAFV